MIAAVIYLTAVVWLIAGMVHGGGTVKGFAATVVAVALIASGGALAIGRLA
jgi:hypothetical protein